MIVTHVLLLTAHGVISPSPLKVLVLLQKETEQNSQLNSQSITVDVNMVLLEKYIYAREKNQISFVEILVLKQNSQNLG